MSGILPELRLRKAPVALRRFYVWDSAEATMSALALHMEPPDRPEGYSTSAAVTRLPVLVVRDLPFNPRLYLRVPRAGRMGGEGPRGAPGGKSPVVVADEAGIWKTSERYG